jgi:N-acetyl-gamma-glutamyl-phosphate reductase
MALRCSILGASGYSGGELLRLLATHPRLEPEVLAAAKNAGTPVAELHPHLASTGDLKTIPLDEAVQADVDLVFSCLPHGELSRRAARITAPVLVDLSEDFRADPEWVYGLPEYARDRIAGAERIANPGCYPTASLLALLPFARAGLISGPIVIDAISGVSGAGRKAEDRLLFSNVDAGVAAYGTTTHRHVAEIEGQLGSIGSLHATVSFTPHLAPMARGLLATARASLVADLDDAGALDILNDAYASEPFVTVVERWPHTKAVSGSNHAQVTARVDGRSSMLVASCAIDNLGKGAAGQAIQNVNIAFGWSEQDGLAAPGMWP